MGKKTIVLADNSYTIRRIVELSFSEIDDVEVLSFENGLDLKNKLLDTNPQVVIVDVKLPIVNGYEICQFINESEQLKKVRVFLMKGSFEPVNQELIKKLKFEEIITKPFDSNQLVASVMKLFREEQPAPAGLPEEMPAGLPEDFPGIENEIPGETEISFSDIREEFLSKPASGPGTIKKPQPEDDDIQPSEEITQGTQPAKEDTLAPEADESIENPFENEPVLASEPLPGNRRLFEQLPDEQNQATVEYGDNGKGSLEQAGRPETGRDGDEGERFPEDLLRLETGGFSAEIPSNSLKEESSGISHVLHMAPDRLADEPNPTPEGDLFPGTDERFSLAQVKGQSRKPAAKNSGPVSAGTPPTVPLGLTEAEKSELTSKLGDGLSAAIKELLWEILPPLAEKIIREEIEKIKTDASKTP